jgi:regulator of replication initiation timing
MTANKDIKEYFSSLHEKIQKLIYLHEEQKQTNSKLLAEKRQITIELDEQREKLRRMEEGYKNLKEVEKTSSKHNITSMKRKINDIILEIDKNMAMIEDK